MQCNKCGTQLNPNEMSCPWCGEPVSYQTPIDPIPTPKPTPNPRPNPQPHPKPTPTPKISSKLIGGIVCAVGALIIVLKLIPAPSNDVVYVTPTPYVVTAPTPTPQPVHEHYYEPNTYCSGCGADLQSFDDVSGVFYGRLVDWESDRMVIEGLDVNDEMYWTENASHDEIYMLSGKTYELNISNSTFFVSYNYDGDYPEYSSIDKMLGYKGNSTGGKTLKSYLGKKLDVLFMLEEGEVVHTEIMYQR